MQKENIKAILFDSDGTLFQSEKYHLTAWAQALKNFNIKVEPESYRKYICKSEKWIESDIKKQYNANFNDGDLIKEKDKIFLEIFGSQELKGKGLMPYARESVDFFWNKSFLLALCTNGGKNETLLKLKNNDMEKYFNIIITAEDVQSPKPAPEIYLAAIEKFGLTGEKCIVVEDTQSGVLSAKAAGAYCFAIPSKFSEGQDFSKADKILNTLKDLVTFFED